MAKSIAGIAVTDTAALDSHISKTCGKATSWTFSAADVSRIAELAEQRLEKMCLAQTHRRGAVVTARSAGPAAVSYGYSVIGSELKLRRVKDGWRMTDYERCQVYPRSAERIGVEITSEQADKSIGTMRRQLRVTLIRPTDSHVPEAA
jgi:hypothetical protein